MTDGGLSSFDAFQQQVGAWSGEIFPRAYPDSITAHLGQAVADLADALHGNGDARVEEEAADCLLVLLHLAHTLDFSLAEATRRKFGRNQRRTGETADSGRGSWKHREEGREDD